MARPTAQVVPRSFGIAIAAAIECIAGAQTRVEEVRLVAFDREMHEQVATKLAL